MNYNYKAIIYGKRLWEKSGRFKCVLCVVKKFYIKIDMVNWARKEINMPNTMPTYVQFFVRKNHVWEPTLKCQVKVPVNKQRKRTLIWGGQRV